MLEVMMGLGSLRNLRQVATSLLLTGALLGGTACASTGGSSQGSRSSPDEISREDILANESYTNAMEIIRSIRPRWLRAARGQGAGTFSSGGAVEPVVLMDGIRFGSVQSLRQVNLAVVTRMAYLNAADATTLYGTGFMGGAIQIFTR